MRKDVKIYLNHILESIELIEEYTKDKTEDDFFTSKFLQDAVIRRIEIIGEAIKNLPMEFREKYNHIPWKEFAEMRDILIRKYFGVDLGLTWEVVKKDIPKLKEEILKIMEELDKNKKQQI